MCGIGGIFSLKDPLCGDRLSMLMTKMGRQMRHRGPDGEGFWINAEVGIGFCHTRLSIMDLSSLGKQPMICQKGRWVISYNGEIYNSQVLRKDLASKGILLKGESDTEVLLEHVSHFGFEKTVCALEGMFAFALWDSYDQVLYLARDQFGIKPLYWSYFQETILFGSELKALAIYRPWPKDVNSQALDSLIHYAYIPSPLTIYNETYKLAPGHFLKCRKNQTPYLSSFWSIEKNLITSKERVEEKKHPVKVLDSLLKKSVSDHIKSDVEVGAFLSGGVDSSLLVSVMQSMTPHPIKTFCIGFQESSYNEAPYAEAIAKHLGTCHTTYYVGEKDIKDSVDTLINTYDEPFADSSQIPTYILSKIASSQVKVVISGDGGDELFGGYKRYLQLKNLWSANRYIPHRNILNTFLVNLPKGLQERFYKFLPHIFRKWGKREAFERLSTFLTSTNSGDLYEGLINLLPSYLTGAKSRFPFFPEIPDSFSGDPKAYAMLFDQKFYLPDDILTKIDRASMAHGLEVRVPFLSDQIGRFSWAIAPIQKINNQERKVVLRALLKQYLPENLFERPKMGFQAPINEWLRGPLKDWASDLLSSSLHESLNAKEVRLVWERHLRRKENAGSFLWPVLVLEAWRKAKMH